MEMNRSGRVTVRIDAPPARVYDLVSDVARTGEWSPECRRCRWIDGADHAEVGARFRGWNRWGLIRWSRVCEVVAADPAREFAFRTVPGRGPAKDSTTWRFTLEPDGVGTALTQSYEIELLPRPAMRTLIPKLMPHHTDMRPHMRTTLERIRAAAEPSAIGDPAAAG